jgi:hypothetical protein
VKNWSGPPISPASVHVRIGRTRDHAQITADRRHAAGNRNHRRFGIDGDRLRCVRPPQECAHQDQYRCTAGHHCAAEPASTCPLRSSRRSGNFHRWRRFPFEIGAVRSRRQLDLDRMIRAVLSEVVLSEFLADFVRGYADDCVLTGVEILRKLKNLDADRSFF